MVLAIHPEHKKAFRLMNSMVFVHALGQGCCVPHLEQTNVAFSKVAAQVLTTCSSARQAGQWHKQHITSSLLCLFSLPFYCWRQDGVLFPDYAHLQDSIAWFQAKMLGRLFMISCASTHWFSSHLMICRGVLNIVHGTNDTVNRICDHPGIKAISFVGSDGAGRYIYERGGKHGKRVQVIISIPAIDLFILSPVECNMLKCPLLPSMLWQVDHSTTNFLDDCFKTLLLCAAHLCSLCKFCRQMKIG